MKTKLLRKLRKEASKNIFIERCECGDATWRVEFSPVRGRVFYYQKAAIIYHRQKTNEYILNRIKSIRESSKPVMI